MPCFSIRSVAIDLEWCVTRIPDRSVHSYNVGDQGFLNWYFRDTWHGNTSRHLPLNYNVLIKYKQQLMWPDIKDDMKVMTVRCRFCVVV